MFETGPGAVDKYIVYCNGEKIGESKTTTFIDTADRYSADRYAVTTLFVNGNESAPQYINADGSSGIFDIEAAAAKKMEAAVEFAMNRPEPDPAHVLDDVFYEG